MLGVRHPIAAYQLDEAVEWFAAFVDGKLNETDPNTHKSLYHINDLLGVEHAGVKLKR